MAVVFILYSFILVISSASKIIVSYSCW